MLICSSYLRLLRCIRNNAELSASKNGQFLNDFEEPPRLLGMIRRYRK